jgi:hypothetical protein
MMEKCTQARKLFTSLPSDKHQPRLSLAPWRSTARPGHLFTLAELQRRPFLRVPAHVRAEAPPPGVATVSDGAAGRSDEQIGSQAPD